ncbi:lipocalin family protein [Epilithonimonas zeae]|uniref:Lipocalin-like domain-containing protein n=1 Tax=Epilithonimonas zeae TaxID=1416779 RepID=A0A1N6DW38_9FLAO|nr:lipocalin family protein [Epilithonimonas zeae]UQB67290.1 lipocalin family protein [Epilithonimonas zeae]SIN74904.1 Lipocalin-like domain-containing protein [Epilithonimonas zeae]
MRKLILGILGIAFFATSCSSTKNASSSDGSVSAGQAQTVRAEVMKLKGEWSISDVDYNKSFKIKPFDEGADINCFVGSSWKLVPNNYTGAYTLNGGGDCPMRTQAITFSVDKYSNVSIKKVGEGEKAKHVSAGYMLRLENPTENSFTLVQSVNADGSPMDVRYNFVRTAK